MKIDFRDPNRRYTNIDLLAEPLKTITKEILADISYYNLPFRIFETGRTLVRQEMLVSKNFSKTLKSKHLITDITSNDGLSHAIDFVIFKNNNWSWANLGNKYRKTYDMGLYRVLQSLIMSKHNFLLKDKGFEFISGGNWASFKDWPHYEIRKIQ